MLQTLYRHTDTHTHTHTHTDRQTDRYTDRHDRFYDMVVMGFLIQGLMDMGYKQGSREGQGT